MVEDANGAVLTNEVNLSGSPTNKLAVIRQSFNSESGEVNVLSKNLHACVAV
jgi:hypothetical protein